MKRYFEKVNEELKQWIEVRDEALDKMLEHVFDDDRTEFNQWSKLYGLAESMCGELDIY